MIKINFYESKCVVHVDNFLFEVQEFDHLVPNLLKSPFICFFPPITVYKRAAVLYLSKTPQNLSKFSFERL